MSTFSVSPSPWQLFAGTSSLKLDASRHHRRLGHVVDTNNNFDDDVVDVFRTRIWRHSARPVAAELFCYWDLFLFFFVDGLRRLHLKLRIGLDFTEFGPPPSFLMRHLSVEVYLILFRWNFLKSVFLGQSGSTSTVRTKRRQGGWKGVGFIFDWVFTERKKIADLGLSVGWWWH